MGDVATRRRWVAGAALLTVLPGFVTLALLGSLRSYPAGLPGFWSYPSGTIGDALLLPVVVGGLVAQIVALKSDPLDAGQRQAEKRWVAAAFVLGLSGGAAVPFSWFSDPHARPNWALPRPHHFDLAGWIHAGYLSVASGVIAALAVLALRRLRQAPREADSRAPRDLAETSMLLVVGAGLGMLILIGRDSVLGGRTAASVTTLAALLVTAAAIVGGLVWAVGGSTIRRCWRGGLIVVAFLLGLTATIVGEWPPHLPLLYAPAVLSAGLGAIALTAPLDTTSPGRQYRWLTALAMTTLAIGGLHRSIYALEHAQRASLMWLVGGVALALLLLRTVGVERDNHETPSAAADEEDPAAWSWPRLARLALFFLYCMLMYYLTARVRLPHVDSGAAGASVSVADIAFDVMVFTAIQAQFGTVSVTEKKDFGREYVNRQDQYDPRLQHELGTLEPKASRASAAVSDVVILGVAVGLALLTLLSAAAGPLGLDRQTTAPAPVRWLLAGALVVLACVCLVGDWRIRVWRNATRPKRADPALDLPWWFWLAPALAALAWALVMLCLAGGPTHVRGIALAGGALVFLLALQSLVNTPIRLQTRAPTAGQKALACAVAASMAVAAYWLVGHGMWQGVEPLPGGWLAATSAGVVLGNLVLFLAAGRTLGWGLPNGRPSEHVLARGSVMGYVLQDAGTYAIVFLVGVVVPLYAASRDRELHGSSLNVVASMVFLPGLINAMVWGILNYKELEVQMRQAVAQDLVPIAVVDYVGGDVSKGQTYESDRRQWVLTHLAWQRRGLVGLMALGLTYLAYVLVVQ